MGAMAEALVAYAQPLIDDTDGSLEQMQSAFTISQICYNLAIMPEESQRELIDEMKLQMKLSDDEFDDFKRSIIIPMIHRHHEMFPRMHGNRSRDQPQNRSAFPAEKRMVTVSEESKKIDRYAPCPCNSGRKHKFCCGKKD